MTKRTTTNQATTNFLFRRLKNDPDYTSWAKQFTIPNYITGNLATNKKLRPYQEEALKTFIWLFENNRPLAKHLLFNMATGTGKTLVMAACILYLYTRGYRYFVFTVGRDNIIKQAQKT